MIARAKAAGVERVLVPAIDPRDWDGLARLRAEWSAVRIGLGVHPHALAHLEDGEVERALAGLAARARALGAVAIGECGLDRRVAGVVPLARQAAIVDAHVEVARALALPLVLHVVGAQGLALERLARHGRLPAGGVVHAFSGSLELARRWVALGFTIGLGPAVLRPGARRPVEVARGLPLGAMLIETDAPDGRPPDTARGEPAQVAAVAARIAELRGAREEDVRRTTFEAATARFG